MKIVFEDDNYFIDVDRLNYTLREKFINDKGEESVRDLGYFNSIYYATKRLVELEVLKDDEEVTVSEFLDRLEEKQAYYLDSDKWQVIHKEAKKRQKAKEGKF